MRRIKCRNSGRPWFTQGYEHDQDRRLAHNAGTRAGLTGASAQATDRQPDRDHPSERYERPVLEAR
jgi:hypothetical protein